MDPSLQADLQQLVYWALARWKRSLHAMCFRCIFVTSLVIRQSLLVLAPEDYSALQSAVVPYGCHACTHAVIRLQALPMTISRLLDVLFPKEQEPALPALCSMSLTFAKVGPIRLF